MLLQRLLDEFLPKFEIPKSATTRVVEETEEATFFNLPNEALQGQVCSPTLGAIRLPDGAPGPSSGLPSLYLSLRPLLTALVLCPSVVTDRSREVPHSRECQRGLIRPPEPRGPCSPGLREDLRGGGRQHGGGAAADGRRPRGQLHLRRPRQPGGHAGLPAAVAPPEPSARVRGTSNLSPPCVSRLPLPPCMLPSHLCPPGCHFC